MMGSLIKMLRVHDNPGINNFSQRHKARKGYESEQFTGCFRCVLCTFARDGLLVVHRMLLVAGCFLLAGSSFAQGTADSLAAHYSWKMKKYLDKEGAGAGVFSFTRAGVEIYSPATDTSQRKFEGTIAWRQIDTLRRIFRFMDGREVFERCDPDHSNSVYGALSKLLSLSRQDLQKDQPGNHERGIRVALDPGHIGGSLETAKMEKKWIEMKPNPLKGIKDPIRLIEGDLALATARILKRKLEESGIQVFMTRTEPGQTAFGVPFKKWKDSLFLKSLHAAYLRGDVSFEEKNFLMTRANETEIFRRFFLPEEMRMRARMINAANPALTLMIHYNADETNVNWNKPSRKNYNMAFVAGSFAGDELETPESKMNFLRLLLVDDIENSIGFSKSVVESLVNGTKVPAALDSCALYLRGSCINTGAEGVFCRNLALTRLVRGTICYGESLYQDNIDECKALSKNEISIDGILTSKRVEEVAEAYFQGIIKYIGIRKLSTE